jgi:hypothetical protein
MTNEKNEKWVEVFSQGDVWELTAKEGELLGYLTTNDASDYEADELADNGISTVYERARAMGLKFIQIDLNGKEVE